LDSFIKMVAATSRKIARNKQIQHIQISHSGTGKEEMQDGRPTVWRLCTLVRSRPLAEIAKN